MTINKKLYNETYHAIPVMSSKKSNSQSHFINSIDYPRYFIDVTLFILKSICPNDMVYFDSFSLSHFIADIFKQSRISYSILLTALVYLMRFKYRLLDLRRPTASNVFYLSSNHHNFITLIFLLSLMISSKFLLDRHPSNISWSMISGITNEELKRGEIYFLSVIDYRLHVQKDTFNNWTCYIFDPKKLQAYQIRIPCPLSPSPSPFIQSPSSSSSEFGDIIVNATATTTTTTIGGGNGNTNTIIKTGKSSLSLSKSQIKGIKSVSPCP